MSVVRPVPPGSYLDSQWKTTKPASPQTLPAAWTATVLLLPFGDSISPLADYSQIVACTIKSSYGGNARWLRARLYLTIGKKCFDFLFIETGEDSGNSACDWYWLDSDAQGSVNRIYGPFRTTLRVPAPTFFSDKGAQWGNRYPLMCTGSKPDGIDCDHWVVPTPGASDHGSWYTFRRDTGGLARVFMMDSTNPLMLPVLGSYYISNVLTFAGDQVSDNSRKAVEAILSRQAEARPGYWNPLVTQEDIQRAMADPLASADCTADDIEAVIPGLVARPSGVALPRWSEKTYIEGWTLGTDFIPYYTRVCYLWTGDASSKQQTVFAGLGTTAGQGTYLVRTDTCLSTTGTTQPYYEWQVAKDSWVLNRCLDQNPSVGLPYPDWVARDGGVVMGQILGNPDFGLAKGETLNLIAAELPRGGGELAIFWLWFLGNGDGMLFTEGNYMNPLSHNLQLIDYNRFVQNADLSQGDFSNPCPAAEKADRRIMPAHGHATRIAQR